MAKHVLVPIDGSDRSWTALNHAIESFAGERITVLHVVDPSEGMYTEIEGGYYDPESYDRAVERGEELCEEALERAAEADESGATDFETAVETGRPSRTILEYVEEHDVDHVVMGSRGRSGLSRVLLGSVAEAVTRRAKVPVTVVR